MSDPFFKSSSQSLKRKRPASGAGKKFNPLLKSARKSTGNVITPSAGTPIGRGKQRPRSKGRDEEIEGSEGEDEGIDDMDLTRKVENEDEDENDESKRETAAHKRLRLAKKYISKLQEETAEEGDVDAAEIDKEIISQRLRDDVLKSKGLLFQEVAQHYENLEALLGSDGEVQKRIRDFKSSKKGNQQSVISVAVAAPKQKSSELPPKIFIYSASKDCVVKWDFWTGKRLHSFTRGLKPTKRARRRLGEKAVTTENGHSDAILCMDVSSDGRYLKKATAGMDKVIHIWSTEDDSHIGEFRQHRDGVTGLAFRKGLVNHLYSCSLDRTVKVWNVDEMTYIETLFGHQDNVLSIDALSMERCVTAGARDRTTRLWKVVEESQMIFRGGGGSDVRQDVVDGLILPSEVGDAKREAKRTGAGNFGGSIDVVAMVDENTFLSGTDSGSISLWNTNKKKPLYTRTRAHGPKYDDENSIEENAGNCNWITALASNPFTDLFASGSCDGFVRLWRIVDDRKSFAALCKLPAVGFVNSIRFFTAPALIGDSDDMPAEEDASQMNAGALRRAIARKREEVSKKTKNVLHLALGLGQEHRMGRWWREKAAKNRVEIIVLGD
ncbi:pre-rRNA processing protein [Dinochytrium kinnereticum]|nr:pre-rRNA processing protein [Dinochytrium kinnereticum]